MKISRSFLRLGAVLVAIIASMTLMGGLAAPYIYAEVSPFLERHAVIQPGRPELGLGAMADDYWVVQRLDDHTFAIGEPRYYQFNYAYLIVGARAALLFDAGSGTRDMFPVVSRLTSLPVTVLPSHLHYDHLGGAHDFARLAVVDLPQTRADVTAGWFSPTRHQYLGMIDGLRRPRLRVATWVQPNTMIDLGGRALRIISTPGHTPESISIYDPAAKRLFSGDFLYPTTLYAFLPGASLASYRDSTQKILADLPPDLTIWGAHCCRVGERPSAPWLAMSDLRDLDAALARVHAGKAVGTGFFPRRYQVNKQMTLATGFPWNNR